MTRRRQNFCDYSKHLNLLNAGETCWSRILDGFSCHRVLTILHEKRKAKKLTNQNKKGPRPIFSRYSISLDGPQLCSPPRRRTFGSSCNCPWRTCNREKEKRDDTFRTSAQEGTVLLCGGSSLPWPATVWFILANVVTCIDSKIMKGYRTNAVNPVNTDTVWTTESIRPN